MSILYVNKERERKKKGERKKKEENLHIMKNEKNVREGITKYLFFLSHQTILILQKICRNLI